MAKKPVVPKARAAKPRRTRVSNPAAKKAREKRLASGVAAGVPVAELARREGLTRCHTSTLVNSAPVRHIITDLVAAHLPEIESLFALGLRCIRDAFENGNSHSVSKTKNPDGSVSAVSVLLGPDHFARMAAMKVLNTIVCAGRAAPKPVDPKDLVPKLTYPELVRLSKEQDELEAAAAREAA